jgi:predicted small secreted protein
MKTTLKTIKALSISTLLAFGLAACDSGPAESAGEKIDEVATDAGNAIEDACENVKEGMKAENENC